MPPARPAATDLDGLRVWLSNPIQLDPIVNYDPSVTGVQAALHKPLRSCKSKIHMDESARRDSNFVLALSI